MRKFYSDHEILVDTLISLGIKLTFNEDKAALISDEDAERIENIVPALNPGYIGEYHMEYLPGEYYVVEYNSPNLYLRLNSLPAHTFRYRVVCNTLEEAKAIYEKELSATTYMKIEDSNFNPSNKKLDEEMFNLCITKLIIDKDGVDDYETIETSNQSFYFKIINH